MSITTDIDAPAREDATRSRDGLIDGAREKLDGARQHLRDRYAVDEAVAVRELLDAQPLDAEARESIAKSAAEMVRTLREDTSPTMMESFLNEYGLSTQEGVGLMCLAEALLRTPDAETIDDLIADKIESSNWGAHLGQSSSPLVNASTWGLLLTGRILDDGNRNGPANALRSAMRRLGEPVIRTAVGQSMKIMGRQFVLGESIEKAMKKARDLESEGYTYSYDMLGEAARTDEDARRFFDSYAHAIDRLAEVRGDSVSERPGISVKLSALHARYEYTHRQTVLEHLLPRARALAKKAALAGIGFNIDAEEADRLDISLDVIEALLETPELAGWDGFGVVVQAYGRRALPVIDWLIEASRHYDRRIMVRLVKGAYWDTEIKEAQVLGVETFPVYTRKENTDLCFIVCAKRLLDNRDRIYPQLATHNAHTVCAVRHMAGDDTSSYEFQRLHGMGESLHEETRKAFGTRCRIYAPVGEHKDLLAYLVRRLLENGANSSFVNQIVDESIPPEEVGSDPIADVEANDPIHNPNIRQPGELFEPARRNSVGYRLNEPASVGPLMTARDAFADKTWQVGPKLADDREPDNAAREVTSPADPSRVVGHVTDATGAEATRAIDHALAAAEDWSGRSADDRADILNAVADAYEENLPEFCAIACREAGKNVSDGIAEVREAVDFLRYYAAQARSHFGDDAPPARGVVVCVSPWNFPLAIFTGQIAAALAAGNAVVAKPAEQSPLIAGFAVDLMHGAGLPPAVIQLVPGDGGSVGAALTGDPRIAGVCFTGSTATAKLIERALAERDASAVADGAPVDPFLIAETGGLNAMIADSTALPEQLVEDVVMSSFQSAGQRCSALRVLYVQRDVRERTLEMLQGAMEELSIGDPWALHVDVGPVIDEAAAADINGYVEQHADRVLKRCDVPQTGSYATPALLEVDGIESVEREVFGPVLHVATFEASEIDDVIAAVNRRGYGLTFGLHTRIDDRVEQIVDGIKVGNVYVNRNQIGAIVGSQPFGGEAMSGTGPKAGGPLYLTRFRTGGQTVVGATGADDDTGDALSADAIRRALDGVAPRDTPYLRGDVPQALSDLLAAGGGSGNEPGFAERLLASEHARLADGNDATSATGRGLPSRSFVLPGPTGESNRLSWAPRGRVLVVGTDPDIAIRQAGDALLAGCAVVVICPAPNDALRQAAKSGLPLGLLEGRFDPATIEQLTLGSGDRGALAFDVLALSGSLSLAQACRSALAGAVERVVTFVATVDTPERYLLERHVCIDTTAAGGNASLLASVG